MDPVVVTILVLAVFVVGIYIGWIGRAQTIRQQVKNGTFDPWAWGKQDSD